MRNKRKRDEGRDDSSSSDSSSSDAKRFRPRHRQNGGTSRPNDGMPPREGLADIVCAVIELKNVMQLQLSTEEKFTRKIQKLKEKRKKDKKKHEEDLRVLKEDLIRIFKEDHRELKSKIQDMEKEACAEVNHHKAFPSQRSQLSQSTSFRLVIETSISKVIYKKRTVQNEDGGGAIKVVMYNGGDPIAADHHLASVKVELVLIEGGFNEKRDSWSKEEFEKSILRPRETTRFIGLVKDGTFDLINGWREYEGAIIMDNSQQKEVKFGVRIAGHTKIRVLEGVSNPFRVQEGKTKDKKDKMVNKPSSPVRTRNLVEPTSTLATQHGQCSVSSDIFLSKRVSPDEQDGLPPCVIQGVLQKEDHGKHTEFPNVDTAEDNQLSYAPATMPMMVEGNGQFLNGSGQQSCPQRPVPFWSPTSTHLMPNDYSMPTTSLHNLSQAAGNFPVNYNLLASGQDQYNNFPNASSSLAFLNNHSMNSISQLNQFPGGGTLVEGVNHSNVQLPVKDHYGQYRCGQVLLQWDKPRVELKEHRNFLDQLMPLYSTQSRFYKQSFASTSLMDKAHKLLASISSGDSFLRMITSPTSGGVQTPQRRGVLMRPIEPYDPDDGPPVKKQRNGKYQLRFVNRVCNDYFTREKIKSEDGNLLKVALYDENNLVVTSGPLSSASVEIVVLHGDFNAEGQDYWTSEEFSTCLVHPQSVKEPPALGGDRVLALTDGEADLGDVYFQTSSFHARTGKFKMGVEIKSVREESVQEGITSPFLVKVRLGEESSCHRITSLEALLRLSKQAPPPECDARENVKVSTKEELKRKFEKLKVKRKKGKSADEEDLIILKEEHKELTLKIQEMPKEGCAEVTSQRSHLSQSTRFRLVIENSVSRTIYKMATVETEDGGGHIKVVMYDGGNPIAPDHPLASVRVELVVIEGWFDEKRDSWSKEEFEESIIKPRRTTTLTSLVKNGAFNLIGGSCDHEGAIIMDTSQQREVKLGVRITVPAETRVLEGVSNPFKVQDRRSKEQAPNKTGKKTSPVPTRNLVQPTSTHATQHGQGPVIPFILLSGRVSPDEQHGLPPPLIQGVMQESDRGKNSEFPTDDTAEDNRLSYPPATMPPVEDNGQALNGNSQQSSQQIPTPNLWQPTSTHPMQHDQGCIPPQGSMQNPWKAVGDYSLDHIASEHDAWNIAQWNWDYIPEGGISVEVLRHINVQTQIQETCLDRSADCQFTDARNPTSKNTNQNKVVLSSTTTAAGSPPNSEIVEHPPLKTLGSLAMKTSSTNNMTDDTPMVYSKDKEPECIWDREDD